MPVQKATMASPERSASGAQNTPDDSSNASIKHENDAPRKQLTVTFEDVGVEVAGLGQSWGSDCLSVVKDLFTFGGGKTATRVWGLLVGESKGPGLTNSQHILQGISGQVCPGEMVRTPADIYSA